MKKHNKHSQEIAKKISKFTGFTIHPVVIRKHKQIRIAYANGGGPSESVPEEDWTLPIDAYERKDKMYDVWVQGKLIETAQDRNSAEMKMRCYIDEQGKFKELERKACF